MSLSISRELMGSTLSIRYRPDELVPAGTKIEVECRFLAEELFVGLIHVGTQFGIWDGRIIADGTVTLVHEDNWVSTESA